MKPVMYQKLKIIFALFICVMLFNCQKEKDRSGIDYRFPTKIKSLSSQQINGLTHTTYKIVHFYTNGQYICPADSLVHFIEDGSIYNHKQKIGSWSKDRTLHLAYFKKKFYISWIGNWKGEGTSSVSLRTKYKEGNGKDINEIRLALTADPHSTQ